jgi:hypothetical protein
LTKKAYISFISPEILDIAKDDHHYSATSRQDHQHDHPYKLQPNQACSLEERGIKLDMRFCRKTFASHLRQYGGIESEIVDLLQDRVPRTIFARHYFTPRLEYRHGVVRALNKLKKEIEK